MGKKEPSTQDPPKVLHIKLTDEQKREIARFIHQTGDANLDVGISFDADIDNGTVAASTFVVGNAV